MLRRNVTPTIAIEMVRAPSTTAAPAVHDDTPTPDDHNNIISGATHHMRQKTALLSAAIVAAIAVVSVDSANTSATRSADLAGVGSARSDRSATSAATAHRGFVATTAATASRPLQDVRPALSRSGAAADATPQADRARALLDSAAAREAHRAHGDAFVARDVIVDSDGTEHVRMDRTYRGMPVVGGDLVVHSRNGVVAAISQGLETDRRPAVLPGISAERAIAEAASRFDGALDAMPSARLVVFARNVEPTLAYRVHVTGERNNDPAPGLIDYYIDAASGKLLQEDDLVNTAAASGTGKTLTLGNVTINTNSVSATSYQMTDTTRGSGSTWDAKDGTSTTRATLFVDADNVWGNNATSDRASAAADAHYGVAATWDYYKNTFGRNGIFNDGRGVKSYVHYGRNVVNAYWDGAAMKYGDGDGVTYRPLVALDVAGHEMTHGVTQATAALGYYNIKDSGGLNEGSSDILGTLVEYSVANVNDPGDFMLGEEIYINNPGDTQALRRMFKQDADGRSFSCYPVGGFTAAQTGSGGVYDPHFTSGVANRFFYLLAQGAVVPANFVGTYTAGQMTCNNDTGIVGIGRAKAGAIWYRALTVYFTSTTDYPQARARTLQAAADLYGNGSVEYNAVARAWTAASVN